MSATIALIGLMLLAGFLLLPAVADMLSLLRVRRGIEPAGDVSAPVPRLLFLVPAHDEEGHIGTCVSSLLGQAYPEELLDVVVIADNCTDDTAHVARAAGARCLERREPARRGKPLALQWALERLPPGWDALVIVDADTTVDSGFARALSSEPLLRTRVVQAYFGLQNDADSWLTELSGLLNRATYMFRYPLKQRVGLNCPLTGNGMCIGADVLQTYPLRSESITENWDLYAEYTSHGIPITYCREALLFSEEARSIGQGRVQRRRWTSGRFSVLGRWGGAILRSRAIGIHQKLDALAELSVPSPVVHLVVAVIGSVLSVLALPARTAALLTIVFLAGLTPLAGSTVAAFASHPRKGAVLRASLVLPLYAAWRSLVFVDALVRPESRWIRTERTDHSGGL